MINSSKVILRNIFKGLLKRKIISKPRFETISWLTEKKLKHSDSHSDKHIRLADSIIHFRRPYELLHTYNDLFQKEIYWFHSNTSSPLIIDCGANIGISVLYFKKILPDAKIISFEADQNNFELLKKNVLENRLTDTEIINEAVWIHNDGVYFNAAGSEASHITHQQDDDQIYVKSRRLADILEKEVHIDFLKIDIEGAEHPVLMDCAKHLSKVENMFLEYHGKAGETQKLKDILFVLEANHFMIYIKNAADLLDHPFTEKQVANSTYDVQLNIFCYHPAKNANG
jgi:FkbM family methyltransferase